MRWLVSLCSNRISVNGYQERRTAWVTSLIPVFYTWDLTVGISVVLINLVRLLKLISGYIIVLVVLT